MQQRATLRTCVTAAWIIALVAVCCRSFLDPLRNSVYPIYARAADRWLAAEPLCGIAPGHSDAYRYGPPFIPLVLPFSQLPDCLGGVLWRIACTAIFLGAFHRLLGAMRSSGLLGGLSTEWLWLILLPLSLGNINNGQLNVLVAGLLMSAVTALLAERWWSAAVCMALCCLFKLYPLALAAVLVVLFTQRFAWRFCLMMAALLLLPLLLQTSSYGCTEYAGWFESFTHADARHSAALADSRRDLRLLLRLLHPEAARWLFPLIAAGSASFIGVLSLARRRRLDAGLFLDVAFLTVCWMLLCGPATESATYVLLAPFLLWRLADAVRRPGSIFTKALISWAIAAFVVYHAACWFPNGRRHMLALQPLAACAVALEALAATCLAGSAVGRGMWSRAHVGRSVT